SETEARLSPDQRWIAYQSTESGRANDIYIDSFPKPGFHRQVSSEGGFVPRWRQDGKALFYVAPGFRYIMTVPLTPRGDGMDIGAPAPLFETSIFSGGLGRSYNVTKDGRFLVNVSVTEQTSAPITVIHNWAAALK